MVKLVKNFKQNKVMIELNYTELEEISGGAFDTAFCKGVAAVDIAYGAGILLNLWNPVGVVGAAGALAVNTYCFVYG
jgi:hypothetical protein